MVANSAQSVIRIFITPCRDLLKHITSFVRTTWLLTRNYTISLSRWVFKSLSLSTSSNINIFTDCKSALHLSTSLLFYAKTINSLQGYDCPNITLKRIQNVIMLIRLHIFLMMKCYTIMTQSPIYYPTHLPLYWPHPPGIWYWAKLNNTITPTLLPLTQPIVLLFISRIVTLNARSASWRLLQRDSLMICHKKTSTMMKTLDGFKPPMYRYLFRFSQPLLAHHRQRHNPKQFYTQKCPRWVLAWQKSC